MIPFGGIDDSPGAQLLGLIFLIVGIVVVVVVRLVWLIAVPISVATIIVGVGSDCDRYHSTV